MLNAYFIDNTILLIIIILFNFLLNCFDFRQKQNFCIFGIFWSDKNCFKIWCFIYLLVIWYILMCLLKLHSFYWGRWFFIRYLDLVSESLSLSYLSVWFYFCAKIYSLIYWFIARLSLIIVDIIFQYLLCFIYKNGFIHEFGFCKFKNLIFPIFLNFLFLSYLFIVFKNTYSRSRKCCHIVIFNKRIVKKIGTL